jgi:hypothetical protein
MTSVLTIRSADLAHETIEGETIVIDLRAQAYYRLEGAAAIAWQALAQGSDAATLTALLRRLYPAEAAAVAQAVPGFLEALIERGLVENASRQGLDADSAEFRAAAGFDGLALHSFADLEEILWVDPVHDVDEATGWPTLPPSP